MHNDKNKSDPTSKRATTINTLSITQQQSHKQYQIIDMTINALGYLTEQYAVEILGTQQYQGLNAIKVKLSAWEELDGLLLIDSTLNNMDYDTFVHPTLGDKPIDIIGLIAYLNDMTRRQAQNKLKQYIAEQTGDTANNPPEGKCGVDEQGIYTTEGDTRVYITDFKITVNCEYRCIDDDSLNYLDVTITSCRQLDYSIKRLIHGNNLNDIKAFKDLLSDGYCTFLSKRIEHLNALKQYIYDGNYPIIQTVSYGGVRQINDQWAYVEQDKSLVQDGNKYRIEQTIPSIKSSILQAKPINSGEITKLGYHLFLFNAPEICYNLVGYAVATLYKARLRALGINSPHLMIIGEAGSGKTQTLNNILFPLLGLDTAYSSNSITRYSLDNLMASNTTIPIVLDEYKPYMMLRWRTDMISDVMRTSYDGLASARGTTTMQIRELVPKTTLVLVGEAGTSETAILERSVIINMCKRDTITWEHTTAYNWIKEHRDLLTSLSRTIISSAVTLDDNTLQDTYNMCLKSIPQDEIKDDRVRQALAITYLGLVLLAGVASMPVALESARKAIITNSLDTIGESSKSMVDLTLEELDKALPVLLHNTVESYYPYQLINDGNELAINLKVLYPLLQRYCKDYNTGFQPLPLRELQRQLKQCDYYVAQRTVRYKSMISNNQCAGKAWILDVKRLRTLDIDNLIN